MDDRPHSYPTFAAELLDARATITLGDEVGLALRATRHRLGVSQRAYAQRRGWSASRVARLEANAERLRLSEVVSALEGTEYRIALCRVPAGGPCPPAPPTAPSPSRTARPVPVPTDDWPRAELLARVRGGSRRFPGHHDVEQVDYPPRWWWNTEASRIGTVPPHWTAPVPWDRCGDPPPARDDRPETCEDKAQEGAQEGAA